MARSVSVALPELCYYFLLQTPIKIRKYDKLFLLSHILKCISTTDRVCQRHLNEPINAVAGVGNEFLI